MVSHHLFGEAKCRKLEKVLNDMAEIKANSLEGMVLFKILKISW